MLPESTVSLMAALASAGERSGPARALARHVGAEDLLLFVLDAEVGALLPAPGFTRTLPGGRAWRELLARCTPGAVAEALLAFPTADVVRRAWGHACGEGCVLVLLGGEPRADRVAEVLAALPLLEATFRAERRAEAGDAQAAVARAEARRAEALAASLSQAQQELRVALRELREFDRSKDAFLAMLAHELRNPLAPLSTALHLLRTRVGEPAVRERSLDIATRQTRHLSRLVDDLMDVSRISRGRIALQRERLELSTLVGRVAEALQPLAEARGHRLERVDAPEPLWLDADATRLEQVVNNLVTNAVKYTEPGGHIRVSVERQGPAALLRVRDTGVGLAPELLPRVFEIFTQGDQSLARSQGGLGIGLSMVRSLVELHGGQVSAHSEGRGRGSEFRVLLPLAEPHAATTPARAEAQASVEGPQRVLVVDDNVDAAAMLSDVLEDWGHEVRMAHDGEAALRLAEAFRPDCVFLDIGLPGLNGYEVAARLRQREEGAATKLVALTGYGQDSDRLKALEAGFDLHWVKPVDLDVLADLMEPRAR